MVLFQVKLGLLSKWDFTAGCWWQDAHHALYSPSIGLDVISAAR